VLALLVLLGNLLNVSQAWKSTRQHTSPHLTFPLDMSCVGCLATETERRLTRGHALLQLRGLLRVLEDQSVEELRASDLELGLVGLLVLLDPRGYILRQHLPRVQPSLVTVSFEK
jgi:hypothetical protein